jgi:ferric-dicitrate binding protein FerR (iron transport regulator)
VAANSSPNAAHSRHEAAKHVASIAEQRSRTPAIVMTVLTIVAMGGIWVWMNKGREESALTTALAAADVRTLSTASGETSNVTLGDQTVVKLGPDSRLLVPKAFGETVRGVKLDGTGTFTVAPGGERKFTVRAGNVAIAATGTVFTVRGYPNESAIVIRVRDGEVTATAGDSTVAVAAGKSLVIATDGSMHEPTAAELEEATGWTDGTVIVADRPLREAIAAAKRWFALTLLVHDTALMSRKVTLRAPMGSARDAITSLESSGELVRVWEGDNMVLKARRK